jgi:hypothetical protein
MIINKNNFSIECFHNAPAGQGIMKSQKLERKWHLMLALSYVNIDGVALEFGVHKGKTMKLISEFFSNDTVWGFDSFEGLPEDWITQYNSNNIAYPKGFFSLNEIPTLRSNVRLVKGFFNTTLPTWVETNTFPIKFLHVDCDLYSSTREVLSQLNHQIIPGTVICFDEMYPWSVYEDYSAWEEGEFKALREWVCQFDREFEVIARSKYQQCSIKITK